MVERKTSKNEGIYSEDLITSQDLQNILEVNKKGIEINIEVEKQNEQVISLLENFENSFGATEEKLNSIIEIQKDIKRLTEENKKILEDSKSDIEDIKKSSEEVNKLISLKVEKKIEDIDKNLLKLIIILGSAGVGTIFTIVQSYLQHK